MGSAQLQASEMQWQIWCAACNWLSCRATPCIMINTATHTASAVISREASTQIAKFMLRCAVQAAPRAPFKAGYMLMRVLPLLLLR